MDKRRKDWQYCFWLMSCQKDRGGNTVCGAHLADSRALPCLKEDCDAPDFKLAEPGKETRAPNEGWI